MKLLLWAVGFACIAGAPALGAGYTIVGSAWTCQGEGTIEIAESGTARPDQISKAQCLPQMLDGPTTVIAFQGKYAYVCDKLKGGPIDAFYCRYALTRDLRDPAGGGVPEHYSKEMVSPHFFDGR